MARDETDRYRQAATDALEQLDWCIGYLHGIHKTKISSQLAKNRAHIKRSLMQEAAEPVPGLACCSGRASSTVGSWRRNSAISASLADNCAS